MPSVELLVPFLAATAIFAFTPGPGMLYLAVQTMAHGARAGWLSSVAFHLASYLHIFAAAFGVTVLLKTAPILLILLKVIGGCYLIWMGIRLWKRPRSEVPTVQSSNAQPSRQAFRDSLTIEILNPKSALFYFTFLPQFTTLNATSPVWLQILTLGIIANVAFSFFGHRLYRLCATCCCKCSSVGSPCRVGAMLWKHRSYRIGCKDRRGCALVQRKLTTGNETAAKLSVVSVGAGRSENHRFPDWVFGMCRKLLGRPELAAYWTHLSCDLDK